MNLYERPNHDIASWNFECYYPRIRMLLIFNHGPSWGSMWTTE